MYEWYIDGMLVAIVLLFVVLAVLLGVYVMNPFNRFTIVKPFLPAVRNEVVRVATRRPTAIVRQQTWWLAFAYIKCALHIVTSRYVRRPAASGTNAAAITKEIHDTRFRENSPYLISGDHFNPLYVRSLGIFFYPMLDTSIPSTKDDWYDRQASYLRTVTYALWVYAQRPIPTTTIVQTGRHAVTCINIYHFPSDTVYSILFALATLQGKEQPVPLGYSGTSLPKQKLTTQVAAGELVDAYKETLSELYNCYRSYAFDEETGLTRRGIHISGAKDITLRDCAFYDNVIFWKATMLAIDFGIIPEDKKFLDNLKKRILKTFWLPKQGYFLEDLSEEGVKNSYYSSDWLIVLATKFLSPINSKERQYFVRSIEYIQAHDIDQPLPIKYQHETRAHRQFIVVRLAAAAYGGNTIWSFWGLEYIKALLLLYNATNDKKYLKRADEAISAFDERMVRDHGFAELFDDQGRLFQTPLYRSVRQTGWVIGLEQVKSMRKQVAKSGQKRAKVLPESSQK